MEIRYCHSTFLKRGTVYKGVLLFRAPWIINVMSITRLSLILSSCLAVIGCAGKSAQPTVKPEVVHFKSGGIELGGELFKPAGNGPLPVVLYHHGSAAGMLNSQASQVIAPHFLAKGWAFFMPYRRGQGLSEPSGRYILDDIKQARADGGIAAASKKLVELLSTEQLQDQIAAFNWLKSNSLFDANRIATAGNSFGGIEVILGAAQLSYCAAVDASGGAESWEESPELQAIMKKSAIEAKSPVLFFQAENDFNLAPSRVLAETMEKHGKPHQVKIYPPFGSSDSDGHAFAYRGSDVWFPEVFQFIQAHCNHAGLASRP